MMRMGRGMVDLGMMWVGRMRRMGEWVRCCIFSRSGYRSVEGNGAVRRGTLAKEMCWIIRTCIRGLQACNPRTPCQFIEQEPCDGRSGFMHLILLHTPTPAHLFLLR